MVPPKASATTTTQGSRWVEEQHLVAEVAREVVLATDTVVLLTFEALVVVVFVIPVQVVLVVVTVVVVSVVPV